MRKPGSVNQDPIFSNNKLPDGEVGYPGGIFDPLGYSKGDLESLKLKEIKNARLAMLGFAGFAAQVGGATCTFGS
jgi:light-harvesting complex I chlorophyll a/b binding protein 2/light-harvesting complex I chlorophyll a/b binding protein 4